MHARARAPQAVALFSRVGIYVYGVEWPWVAGWTGIEARARILRDFFVDKMCRLRVMEVNSFF